MITITIVNPANLILKQSFTMEILDYFSRILEKFKTKRPDFLIYRKNITNN